ncbi:MAG TPA: hypothetical protein VH476_04615 [Solirubrobacterales bacterium]|jgi:hypothetical protein
MRLASPFTERRALAITLCWVGALAVTGSTDALLFLAPSLLIAIPILWGRYPGEELIARFHARRAPTPSRPPLPSPQEPRAPRTWRPVGSLLLGFSLAKRPPPVVLLAQN